MPEIHAADWGCAVRDLETSIVVVQSKPKHSLSLHPQKSHKSQTLARSWFRDSATASEPPGDDTTTMKVESSAR